MRHTGGNPGEESLPALPGWASGGSRLPPRINFLLVKFVIGPPFPAGDGSCGFLVLRKEWPSMALLAEGIESLTILWILIAFLGGAGLSMLIDRAYLRSVGRVREKILEEGKKEAEAHRKE